MATSLAQLRAVIWKAWCSRRFHYFYTLLDIILPLLLAYLLVIFKGQHNGDEIEPQKIFLPSNKSFLMQNSYEIKLNILYAPNNTATNNIMSRVWAKLNPKKIGNFMAMKDVAYMEKWLFNDSVTKNSSFWEEAYGIEFHNVSEKSNVLEYSIKNTKFDVWHTNLLFPEFPSPGPMESSTNYISQGFLALQIAIDEAFMDYKEVASIEWFLQEFPYPEYRRVDKFSEIYKEALPLLLCYGFLFSVVTLIRMSGEEKESGIRERLRMVGVQPLTTYLGWIIDYALVTLVSSAFLTIMLTAPWISKNGAILEKSNFLIIWITIYLFYLSGTLLALTVANIFTRPKYSVIVGILVWLTSFGFFTYVLNKSPSSETLFFMSIVPNGYLLSSMNAVVHLEVLGTGAKVSTLFHYSGRDGIILPLGYAWIAVLCGLVIFGALILYLDAVLPGQYGIAKPWYFLIPQRFLRSICKVGPKTSIVENGSEDSSDCPIRIDSQLPKDSKVNCEPLAINLPIGIQIRKLTKTYGTVLALKDFSIDIYKNEITALLGHNGAGKTTLLSVVTGMLTPSNGDVKTDDYNVFENLAKFRNDLGYCPQDDLLLPNLTVAQHIIFFGMVKGLTMSEATTQANVIMAKCRLSEKRNSRVAMLSGGMKRKLCLAVSLVNDPKILILDEPTSGLDPESRRAIWDILLELRKNRTILLTTHFMEEADVLGDRIAIMSHGELKCYGTSLFLKKNYGSGYQVTILLAEASSMNHVKELIDLVNQEIGELTVLCESPESITIQLPLNSVSKFPTLFQHLEHHQNVKSLAVSCTTIDDVFQKVNEEEGIKFSVDEVDMPVPYSQLQSDSYTIMFKKEGQLFWQRLCAIKEKKLIWIRRNWKLTLLYLALPLFLVIIATYKTSTSTTAEDLKPLELSLNIYGRTDVILDDNQTDLGTSFWKQIQNTHSSIVKAGSLSIVDALLEYGRRDEAKYRTNVLVAASMDGNLPTVLYSSIGYHSIPIAVNLISNAIINRASPNSSSYLITTYNDPYLFNSDSCSGGASEMASSIAYTIVLVMELTLIVSYFMIHVHMERTTMFKELQLLTGLRYYFYWLFTFVVDFFIYLCIISLLLAVMLVFDASALIRDWAVLGDIILVFLLFVVSSLWCVYFYSFFFRTYNGTTLFYTVVSIALCIAGIIICSFDAYKNWKYVFFLNPVNPLAAAIFKVISESKFNEMCEICKGPSIAILCQAKREMENSDDFDTSTELTYLSLDWIFYVVLIFLIESGFVSFLWHHLKSVYIGKIAVPERPLDKDVFEEKQKIKNSQNIAADDQVLLVVDGLAKKYSRSVSAVKDVSFVVSPGQCFGLLGTNGAGKSTTFQMLTSCIRPTSGDATVNVFSLMKARNQSEFVILLDHISNRIHCSQYKDQIGYCPQSAGLLEDLTGKETLRLFAALNGEPSNEIEQIVQKWLNLLGLKEYENRPTSTYSGGNLRKLSTAIALIGNPPVVFLDEPTTGVDPVTRHKIWQVLKLSLAKNQTVVIASHSMDECEALCDRLTIMVQGTMHCLGNIQYLKKTYGKGFTILIKLGVIANDTLSKLKQKMESMFSHLCTLRDEHKGLLHYHLEDSTCKWSTLFKNMAELKADFPGVEDYVLTDSSLEQIFLAFAAENNTA